jgi:hypothetical protein
MALDMTNTTRHSERRPLTLYLTEDLDRWVRQQAEAEERTISNFCKRILRRYRQEMESGHSSAA